MGDVTMSVPWVIVAGVLAAVGVIFVLAFILVVFRGGRISWGKLKFYILPKTKDAFQRPVDEDLMQGITPIPGRGALNAYINKVGLAGDCKEIDMLGWNLWNEYISDPKFIERLQDRLTLGQVKVRILLPDRDSEFMRCLVSDRALLARGELGAEEAEGITERYEKSLARLKLLEQCGAALRMIKHGVVTSGIVRFDDLLVATQYIPTRRGSGSAAWLVDNNKGGDQARALFSMFYEAFQDLWDRNRPRSSIVESRE